jgi:hypothetical protein
MKMSTTLRNARAAANISAAGTNPKYKLYTGTESLTPAGTLLATLAVTGALGTSTDGVVDVNETITQNSALHVGGVPTFCLLTTSADVPIMTFAIPGEMSFSGAVVTGVDIPFTPACTLTEGYA